MSPSDDLRAGGLEARGPIERLSCGAIFSFHLRKSTMKRDVTVSRVVPSAGHYQLSPQIESGALFTVILSGAKDLMAIATGVLVEMA